MEHILLRASQLLESTKTSERKKGVKELSEHLSNPEAIQILNRNKIVDSVNWNILFVTAHRCLLLESERWQAEESKGGGTASTATTRENLKVQFASLVETVVKKANASKPTIKCDDILLACSRVFSDRYLLRNFGPRYISILQGSVLPVRKYRNQMNHEQWNELFNNILSFFQDKRDDLKDWAKHCVIDLMELVVYYGCQQSHLGTQVKNKLLPLLQTEFITLNETAAVQEALLSLTYCVCTCVAKESRTGVCHLGELILNSVIKMYDCKCEVNSPRNKLVIDFLLFQMQCHHPNGVKQSNRSAYACDWVTWNSHICAMYRVVITAFQRKERTFGLQPFSDSFLELCVELCNQLFDNKQTVYDMSLTVNETVTASAPKRRKWTVGTEAIFEELQSGRKDPSCGHWILLMFRILQKYPTLLQNEELYQLLDILNEMQCNCRKPEVMKYICKCCEQLLEVMAKRKLTSDIWLKVWETTIRSVGLNQIESHPLLRKLISMKIVPTNSLQSLLRMFQSQMIQFSNESLCSLMTFLSHFPLPESADAAGPTHLAAPWELPTGTARMVLLDWLMTVSWDVTIDMKLLAKVLVTLVMRGKSRTEVKTGEPRNNRSPKTMSMTENYSLSVFENGLLLPSDIPSLHHASDQSLKEVCQNLVDSASQLKLQSHLETRCRELNQRLTDNEDNMNASQRQKKSLNVLQLKLELTNDAVKYTCLLVNVLSCMVKYGAVETGSLDGCCLCKLLHKVMDLLKILLPDVLKVDDACQGLVPDSPKVCKVLESLSALFSSNLVPSVCCLLRNHTTTEIMLPVVNLFEESPNDHSDEFLDLTYSNATGKKALQETSALHVINVEKLTDVDRIHILCLDILTCYGCPENGNELNSKQITIIDRIIKTFKEGEIYDLNLLSTFVMVFRSFSKILGYPHLDREKHLNEIILLLPSLCSIWVKDAEVSSYILMLLKDVFKHVAVTNEKWEKVCAIKLFSVLKTKKFGPAFSIQIISCYETLIKVDKNSTWARWTHASSLNQEVDVEDIPSEASRKFDDSDGKVAVVEEVLYSLLSPFHEVRLASVSCVAGLLSGQHHSGLWQQTMFARLTAVLWNLFIVKDCSLTREEKIDEGSNRTSLVLHVLSAVVARSSKCYKQALLLVFRIMKVKQLNIGAVKKAFELLAEPMKLKTIQDFLSQLLAEILEEWLKWGYQITEFPVQLMNFSSVGEFLKCFKGVILPVILRNKESKLLLSIFCKEVQCTVPSILETCFPSIFAYYLPYLADTNAKNEANVAARKQFQNLTSVLGTEKIKELVSEEIASVLVEVTKHVWDAAHHEVLLSLDPSLIQPNIPFISYDNFLLTLKYLQETFETEADLLVYISCQKPIVIHKVLLQLREDMCAPTTVDQRILSLHRYCAFSQAVAVRLQKEQLPNIADFILGDITHSLLYLIHENQQDPVMYDVCVGSCSYLKVVFEHLLPVCAPLVSHILHTIVGCLIPISLGSGVLAKKSLQLLNLLIVTHRAHLGDSISQLPPFPDAPGFEDMRRIHSELKYGANAFTLEDEIKHFLSSTSNISSFANQNSLFDGLHFLQKEFSEKKKELTILYRDLEAIRGFTKDCKESILHQLVCTLIRFSSSTNLKIQMEAARCLGELGPADLTTLVLKPAEGCFNMIKGFSDPMKCVMALAAHLLSDYLMEQDVCVVKAASSALYRVMACRGADSLHSNRNDDTGMIESRKIAPFISKQAAKVVPSLSTDSTKIISMLCQDDIWCPGDDIQHKEWITALTCALFTCLSDGDSYFKDLVSVSEVKTSFSEEMLPVLFYLGLTYSPEICHQLCTRLSQFFENHCSNMAAKQSSQTSSTSSSSVYLNRASVQCMLNVVNFVRLQKSILGDGSISFELNYLHVASAAQFCAAYFSSIMYLELWCNYENRHSDFDGGAGVPYVDYICEINPEDGKMLQSLLREAYKQIGDLDALYGCGSSMLHNPSTRVNQYEYVGKWDKVLLNYDVKLSHSHEAKAANGLANALKSSGLFNLLDTFLGSLPSDQKDELYSYQMECMWRLGKWSTPYSPPSKVGHFEWNQYSALQAIRDGNMNSVNEFITEGRLVVLSSLSHSSLESCNNIYKGLSQLQALQEIEDFASDRVQEVTNKWNDQSALPYNDISLLEPVLAQRAKILENLIYQHNVKGKSSEKLNNSLTQLYLGTAELARKEDQIQIAEQWLHSLSLMPHLSVEDKRQLCFEEAQLAWSSGKGAVDVATNSVARQLLGKLLKELQSAQTESRKKLNLQAQALILYGRWMAETCSENPQHIIENYLHEALQILDETTSRSPIYDQLEAHNCLAHFADLEYQRITTYIKSESFQNKVKCMEDLRNQGAELKQMGKNSDLQRTATISLRCSTIDEEEIKHTYQEQNHYLELAMRHYLISLKLGQGENLPVFRMVSLWLENTSHEMINKLVSSCLDSIQTFKFVILLPQLAARVGDNMKDTFIRTLQKLLIRCCTEHPHHTLSLILALANSYKDPGVKVKPNPEPRVLGAAQMLSELQKNKSVKSILIEMEKLSSALISLAYAEIPNQQLEVFSIPKDEKIRQLKNLNHAMLPIITLPVQSDAKYDNIIGIYNFEPKYWLAGGINKPKKIMCVGTDGIKRTLLVKGNDDLRQDAVMQQVFTILNTLLQACKETKRRRLLIRTYRIVPLSQRCGVLQWCDNTVPIQNVLSDVHTKYGHDTDLKGSTCRKMIENARQKSNAERLQVYKDVCKKFHPAFRYFFIEKFPTPAEWFDHRLAYVHSVATNSMVGYILGLGDRHIANILIDKSTAELIHIDFGIAFEQGRLLPTPETVPFRLTRDIVDGMGVSGIEGVFRRSCEKTMSVLRKNQEKILTILEVLLYDPLYAWTVTPKKAASRQRETSSRASVSSDSEGKEFSQNKNKMAERVLSRLQKKLQGTEEGPASSIEGQVNRLIQQARDPSNLSRLFVGWQAYY